MATLAKMEKWEFSQDKNTNTWYNLSMPTNYVKRWENGKVHLIHRKVWESVNGKIPKGMQIHHIDGNKENNHISNLQCITPQEHRAIHTKELRKRVFVCKICKKDFRSGSYWKPTFCSIPCRKRDYFLLHGDYVNQYKRKWREKRRALGLTC